LKIKTKNKQLLQNTQAKMSKQTSKNKQPNCNLCNLDVQLSAGPCDWSSRGGVAVSAGGRRPDTGDT
jgi:hypothetical protein